MLDALAYRVDAGVARPHLVIDANAAAASEAGLLGERGVGSDAHRHGDQVGRQHAPVREPHCLDAALTGEPFVFAPVSTRDAAPLQVGREEPAAHRIELPLHQCRHQMHDRDLHAPARQPVGRLQPEQPAADHHGRAACALRKPPASPRRRPGRGRSRCRAGPCPAAAARPGSSRSRARAHRSPAPGPRRPAPHGPPDRSPRPARSVSSSMPRPHTSRGRA